MSTSTLSSLISHREGEDVLKVLIYHIRLMEWNALHDSNWKLAGIIITRIEIIASPCYTIEKSIHSLKIMQEITRNYELVICLMLEKTRKGPPLRTFKHSIYL